MDFSSVTYAGDITPAQAFTQLGSTDAVLLDVRTPQEWREVGVPAISQVIFVPWLTELGGPINPDFVEQVRTATVGDRPVLVICRSGQRSVAAAHTLTAAEFGPVFNVLAGFEGDQNRGWSAEGLPVSDFHQLDRAAGVLLGQAVGDALGVPYEFGPPFEGPAQMLGFGLGPYAPGEYSDDTQMAVVIAQVAATGVDLTDDAALDQIADGFLTWLEHGASDVGTQTRNVLSGATPGAGSAARLRERAHALHRSTGRTAGNGALMRTGVVGLTALNDRHHTAAAARAIALLTHYDQLAVASCVLWSEAVRVAVTEARFDLLSGLDLLPVDQQGQWETWIRTATGAPPSTFAPNGFTVPALQAAWAAITSTPEGLEPALHAAVHAGDDTDTVAAIAGTLLGARWGASAIPAPWRNLVHGWPGFRAQHLTALATTVHQFGVGPGPVSSPSSSRGPRPPSPV